MSHPIFCQTCFETTHNTQRSVWEIDTNGRCSKCGSEAVIDAILMATMANITQATRERERRSVPYNTDLLRSQDIRDFLSIHDPEAEGWWDGTYFEHHLWFLLHVCGNGFELMLENRNGEQRSIVFSVKLQLEVSDCEKPNQG